MPEIAGTATMSSDGQVLGGAAMTIPAAGRTVAEVERPFRRALTDGSAGRTGIMRSAGASSTYRRAIRAISSMTFLDMERPFLTFDDTLAYCYHVAIASE
jgi:uncharacterized membrane protein